MSEQQPLTLPAKLAAIMGEVGTLSKDGHNKAHKYDYVTDTTVFNAVRALLAKYNVALLSSMTAVQQNNYTTKNGTDMTQTVATFQFRLICGDTGEVYECLWQAEANDASDKGINKCATAALKNWLLKTFCMSTGDDPDGDAPPARNNPMQEMDSGPGARHLTRDETTKLYEQAKAMSLDKIDLLTALEVESIAMYQAVAPYAAALQAIDDYIEAQTTAPATPKNGDKAEQPELVPSEETSTSQYDKGA